MPKNIEYTPEQNADLIDSLTIKLNDNDLSKVAEAIAAIGTNRDARDFCAAIREAVAEEEETRLTALRAAKKTPAPPPSV